MTMYFSGITDLDSLKRSYRRWAMQLHPDCGGTDAAMQELNRQYEEAMKQIRFHAAAGSKDAESTETASEFISIIDLLIKLDGLNIELCGSWLWIGGETRKHKDALKAAGCRWASKKQLWYWHPAGQEPTKTKRTATMSHIREKYGSRQISGVSADAIRAC